MSSPARPEERAIVELRAAIVAAGVRLAARGLISAGEGNVSVRLDETRLLVTPAGRRKDELEPGDLVVASLTGSGGDGAEHGPAQPRPSSDLAIHRAILRARLDVTAVAHAHLPASMALTLAGVVPDPEALPETATLLARLPYVPFGTPGSDELAGRVAAAFVEGTAPLAGAVLLERHGAIAVGSGHGEAALREAVDRLELVEVLCRTWRDALLVEAAQAAGGDAGGLSFRGRTGGSVGPRTRTPGRER